MSKKAEAALQNIAEYVKANDNKNVVVNTVDDFNLHFAKDYLETILAPYLNFKIICAQDCWAFYCANGTKIYFPYQENQDDQ